MILYIKYGMESDWVILCSESDAGSMMQWLFIDMSEPAHILLSFLATTVAQCVYSVFVEFYLVYLSFNYLSLFLFLSLSLSILVYSTWGSHVGVGGAPLAGEAPVAEAAVERSVLHAEAPASKETWKGSGIKQTLHNLIWVNTLFPHNICSS